MAKETVEQACRFFHYRLNAKGCFGSPFVRYAYKHGDNDRLVVYIRKTFNEFEERVMAALKREIIVERNFANAHIFSLLEKIDEKDAEIAKRNALIKELANALDVVATRMKSERGCSMRDCSKCKNNCYYIPSKLELVAKARELVNVPRGT